MKPAELVSVKHDVCKGTGAIRSYPRDSQWCVPCSGTGSVSVHRTDVKAYGCNRCQTTWPGASGPYCETCGADATHYDITD